jgi:hypothetical protein
MMQEILKPLLESDVLTDEVKNAIETSLTEAIAAKEEAVRAEVEAVAKANFEAAKTKFEETYKILEETYKTKLDEAKIVNESAKSEIEELESKIEELETKPFINVTEADMENAEKQLLAEMEEKYEGAFDLGKEKFNNTFDVIAEAHAIVVENLENELNLAHKKIDELLNIDLSTYGLDKVQPYQIKIDELKSERDTVIAEAIAETEERMRAEADERIEAIKENLVISTEIFLEQELAEIKADKESIMKETQGRELLESIKGLVKQYWDIDSEVAEEILEMKKDAEAKVEQYKDMLKKEHNRLEESQAQVEALKKKVIVESKGSILAGDKKVALEKLAENIDSNKLESQIDSLMESVIDTFNAGFSKKEVTETINNTNTLLTENTVISSGDNQKIDNSSDELANLLAIAGIRK